jgi:hypothetical protein
VGLTISHAAISPLMRSTELTSYEVLYDSSKCTSSELLSTHRRCKPRQCCLTKPHNVIRIVVHLHRSWYAEYMLQGRCAAVPVTTKRYHFSFEQGKEKVCS